MRTASRRRLPAALGPVSVVLPSELRARVRREAKRRGLGLSPAIRVLLTERVEEIEGSEQLSKAEEWQRAQAWSTWEKIKAGDVREVTLEQIDADIDAAISEISDSNRP